MAALVESLASAINESSLTFPKIGLKREQLDLLKGPSFMRIEPFALMLAGADPEKAAALNAVLLPVLLNVANVVDTTAGDLVGVRQMLAHGLLLLRFIGTSNENDEDFAQKATLLTVYEKFINVEEIEGTRFAPFNEKLMNQLEIALSRKPRDSLLCSNKRCDVVMKPNDTPTPVLCTTINLMDEHLMMLK